MKMNFRPKSRSGRWAVGIGYTLVAVTLIEVVFASVIGGDSAVIERSPALTVLADALSVIFTLAGPLSFIFGMYTGIRHKEWSVWKPLAVSYVCTLALFLTAEFLFPH
jgi:hypothetical protein